MRNKAERRHNNLIKALRKRSITRNVYHINEAEENPYQTFCVVRKVRGDDKHGYYGNLHQYSKNKIHSSYPYGNMKTNNRGRQKYYGQGGKLWKPSDLRKIIRLEEQLECHT